MLAAGKRKRYRVAMVTRQTIHAFVEKVATQFRPERVILFGSYARGKPTADSDVDILVVMPHRGSPTVRAAEIRKRIHAGFPLDLVVRSPAEVRRRLAMDDCFIREVLEEGLPLYEG